MANYHYEVEVFVRDSEGEVVRRGGILMEDIEPGQKLEVWVNDKLKFEETNYEEDV